MAPVRFYSTETPSELHSINETPKPTRVRRPVKAPLTITESAAQHLQTLLSKKDNAIGIKLGVKRRGCNGYSYTMDYTVEKPKFFEEVSEKGVSVFIEPKALMYVVGTTMDYVEDELSAEFVFKNPNAKGTCGCGESFNV